MLLSKRKGNTLKHFGNITKAIVYGPQKKQHQYLETFCLAQTLKIKKILLLINMTSIASSFTGKA